MWQWIIERKGILKSSRTPYSPVKVNWRFGEYVFSIFRVEALTKQNLLPTSRWFLAWLIIRLRRWSRHVPPKSWLTFNGLKKKISVAWVREQIYRPSDRRLSAKKVPSFADRGCRTVSVTDPNGRILGFLDRFNGPHGAISQKIELRITKAVSLKSYKWYIVFTNHSFYFGHHLTARLKNID
jgi:hypothetical protein